MNDFVRTRAVAITVATSIIVAGCATPGGPQDAQSRSALDRSINVCLASIGIGVLVDIFGEKRRPGTGTGTGVLVCAVVLVINNEADKKRIRDNQLVALNTGRGQTDRYVGPDGQARIIKTSVTNAEVPKSATPPSIPPEHRVVGPCRHTQTEIAVQGKGTTSLDRELVCRTAQGDWIPWNATT